MKFQTEKAIVYYPQNKKEGKCAYMAISAHQDDIEIMATDGILKAFDSKDETFYAVVATDGAGSARNGLYADYTDEMMKQVRVFEQRKAAEVGAYGGLISLNYTSKEAKDAAERRMIEDFKSILSELKPRYVYTHNLCDKHDTHVGVVTKVIKAIRELDPADRPEKVYGCEVWRDLDWMLDDEKVIFDVSAHENLKAALLGVFDSQIAGGKRYDAATAGRRLANATFSASHAVDTATSLAYAMDLTPLVENPELDMAEYAVSYLDHLRADIVAKINRVSK